jgi:hypothetical protein
MKRKTRRGTAGNNKATTGVVAWKSARQGANLASTIPLNEVVERGVAAKWASSGSAWRCED